MFKAKLKCKIRVFQIMLLAAALCFMPKANAQNSGGWSSLSDGFINGGGNSGWNSLDNGFINGGGNSGWNSLDNGSINGGGNSGWNSLDNGSINGGGNAGWGALENENPTDIDGGLLILLAAGLGYMLIRYKQKLSIIIKSSGININLLKK